MQLTATTADCAWRTALSANSTATVESVFRRALNLKLGSSELLTIFPKGSPNSPGGLVASHTDGQKIADIGETVTLTKDSLVFSGATIALVDCKFVNNSLAGRQLGLPSLSKLEEFKMHLVANARLGSFYGPLEHDAFNEAQVTRLMNAREHLMTSLRQQSLADITIAVSQLLGLGIGLTPSGDDYLLGHLAVLNHSSISDSPAVLALRKAITANLAQTTSVSQQYLRAGLAFRYSQPIRRLLGTMAQENDSFQPALSSALEHGATSGQDTCTGMMDAWKLLHENN